MSLEWEYNQSTEAGLKLLIDYLLLIVQFQNVSLIEGVTISDEGLQKLGLKSVSIIYSLDIHCSKLWNYLEAKGSLDIKHLYHWSEKTSLSDRLVSAIMVTFVIFDHSKFRQQFNSCKSRKRSRIAEWLSIHIVTSCRLYNRVWIRCTCTSISEYSLLFKRRAHDIIA